MVGGVCVQTSQGVRDPIPTTKKPDMVVWCEDEKEIHIVKLTEPHDNNVAAAHDWKDARYEGLLDEWTGRDGKP